MQEKGRDWLTRRSSPEVTRFATVESNTLTQQEYIAKLEAELRGFKGDSAKASSSKAVLPYDPTLHRRTNNDEGSVKPTSIVQLI